VPKVRHAGQILPLQGFAPLDGEELGQMLREICLPERWQRYERTGDLDFIHTYGDKSRFRTNYNRQYSGHAAVFRAIPSRIRTIDELGFPPVFNTFAEFRSGLIVITSPGGGGKSTTVAAILNHINETRARHIMTLEEPVEFVHPPRKSAIVQRGLGIDVQSYPEAIQGALRQDVDVLFVGELRDRYTTSLAVSAAEAGVLVISTLYTDSAVKTVARIIETFPENQQPSIQASLAVSLRAACSQVLLRRADGSGMIAAYEILLQNLAISNTIREGKTTMLNQIMMSNRAMGMQLMDDCINEYLNQRIIDGREAWLKAQDKERFAQFAPQAG
jgi:twitching motility protein PilT